ncbi:hypothetical protein IAU59_000443 [Kwoniella sp. CBS 9459]
MSSSFATFELPPIPHFDEPLPPLPAIEDKTIETRVFTHSSYVGKKRTTGTLLFDAEEEGRDNEKYEHLGDSLLGVTVTLLLQDMYPTLSPGTATTLRSLLVSNRTLRQISHFYQLPSRLLAPPEQRAVLVNGDHVPANLFEAYIAGVYYSYLSHGSSSEHEYRTNSEHDHDHDVDLDGDIKPNISAPGPSANGFAHRNGGSSSSVHSGSARHTSGQARDYLDSWLRPLFSRIAIWALTELKGEQARQRALQITARGEGNVVEDPEIDQHSIGALARLNEWFIAKEGGQPAFIQEKSGAEWKLECRAVDRDGNVWCGAATRANIKSAKTVAAYKVCMQFKAVRPEFDRS